MGARSFRFFVYIRSYCAPLARAERNVFGCHFLARPKKWRKKGAKGSNTPWIPAARHGKTSFSRLWRENEQIQLLRWRLEVQAPTRKCHASREANFFATCDAPLFAQILSKDGKQHLLLSLSAAQTGRRGRRPLRDSKNFANNKPICGVRYMPRRWRALARAKAPPFVVKRRELGGSQGERLG